MSGLVFLSSTTKQRLMCLAQGLNTVTPMRLESETPRSWDKNPSTKPTRAALQRNLLFSKRTFIDAHPYKILHRNLPAMLCCTSHWLYGSEVAIKMNLLMRAATDQTSLRKSTVLPEPFCSHTQFSCPHESNVKQEKAFTYLRIRIYSERKARAAEYL